MPSRILEINSKWDINIAGAQFRIFSEDINDNSLLNQIKSASSFNPKYLLSAESNRSLVTAQLALPSVVYKINERSAVAFSSNLRSFTLSQVSDSKVKRILNAIYNKEPIDESLSGEFVIAYSNSWLEFGFTYARSWELGSDWIIQGGATLNFLSGIASAHLEFADVSASFSRSVANNFNADFGFVYNTEIDDIIDDGTINIDLFKKRGFSADFGVTAIFSEFLTLGLSLMDLGHINYQPADNSSQLKISNTNLNLQNLYSLESLSQLADTLKSNFNNSDVPEDKYTTHLPIRFVFLADIVLIDWLSISIVSNRIKPGFQDNTLDIEGVWTHTLMPRYTHESLNIALPLVYNRISNFQAGFGINWKFLVLGSDNVFTFLISDRDIKSLDLYLAFRVSIGN